MAAPIGRGSTSLDFGDLTPEDFERICFLIVQIEFGVSLVGDDVWIGELRGELSDVAVTEDGEEMVQLLVRPVTDEGRRPTFKLFPSDPAVTEESS